MGTELANDIERSAREKRCLIVTTLTTEPMSSTSLVSRMCKYFSSHIPAPASYLAGRSSTSETTSTKLFLIAEIHSNQKHTIEAELQKVTQSGSESHRHAIVNSSFQLV